jgi:cytochrome c oxidase cbb3-type subunit 3
MSNENLREHTFDGIHEFDNRLPNWWLWSFYLACIFSVFYWIHYHTLGTGALPTEEYAIEQQLAAAKLEAALANATADDEMLLKLAAEPAVVAAGKEIFENPARCALCHKPDGSGLIGPNLTDDMWIYGSKPMDIYTSISEGRPGGMLPHKHEGTQFLQRATAYTLTLKGKNLPGKPPEPNAKKDPQ